MTQKTVATITISAVAGFIPLLIFIVGSYHSYQYYLEWEDKKPKPAWKQIEEQPKEVLFDMSLESLKKFSKQIDEEIKYREGKK
jgi:hypothetical protein